MNPGLLFVNFGGPTRSEELESFLRELFDDVLPLPDLVRGFVAARIAASRSKKVGPQYEAIGWSPLVQTTSDQMDASVAALGVAPPHAMGMLFTPPTVATAVRELREQGADAIVALAMFPHYSIATTGAAYDRVWAAVKAEGGDLPVHFVPPFFDHPAYIRSLANTIRHGAAKLGGDGPIHLLFSPHGLPLSYLRRGDPYPDQVRESIRRVIAELAWSDPWLVGWQSRVGPTKWLTPGTDATIEALGRDGAQRVLVVPISFVGEHIETLYEIGIEYADLARNAGIPHFHCAPAVGTDPDFVACLTDLCRTGLDSFGTYSCVRCLVPKPDAHRRQKKCANCRFGFPAFLREPPAYPAVTRVGNGDRDADGP